MSVDPPPLPDRHSSGAGTQFRTLSPSEAVVPLIAWQSRHFGAINLPPDFPEAVASPKYAFGTHCRWTSQTYCERGIVIGQVYAPDDRESPTRWSWVYLILLHPHSPSWGWITADWVDEDDLEPLYPSRGI